MNRLIHLLTIGLAFALIFFPEPLTTVLGLALLSWALWHKQGGVREKNGACRCDACRYGISSPVASFSRLGGVSSPPPQAVAIQQERYRRAQATLPLILGRGPTRFIGGSHAWL